MNIFANIKTWLLMIIVLAGMLIAIHNPNVNADTLEVRRSIGLPILFTSNAEAVTSEKLLQMTNFRTIKSFGDSVVWVKLKYYHFPHRSNNWIHWSNKKMDLFNLVSIQPHTVAYLELSTQEDKSFLDLLESKNFIIYKAGQDCSEVDINDCSLTRVDTRDDTSQIRAK